MATIGLHTLVTNPLSAGYLAYLACIESWAAVCDELTIVDGGSTDGSIDFLEEWLGHCPRITVISNSASYWGPGDDWDWPQIAINRHIGLEHLTTDWAIHVDADHVVDLSAAKTLRADLDALNRKTLLSMWVGYYADGVYHRRARSRAWVLNLRRIREEGLPIGYGMDRVSGTGLDYPVYKEEQKELTDRVTRKTKTYYVGESVPVEDTIPLECFRYGHFFFTKRQCLDKCIRLEAAISRFRGLPAKSPEEIARGLNYHNLLGYQTAAEMLSHWHPPEIKRAIERFYVEGMLGGARYRRQNLLQRAYTHARSSVYRIGRRLARSRSAPPTLKRLKKIV